MGNAGARPGDAIVFTKPIGTGLITTGIKRGVVDDAIRNEAVETMARLNAAAARAGVESECRQPLTSPDLACSDTLAK